MRSSEFVRGGSLVVVLATVLFLSGCTSLSPQRPTASCSNSLGSPITNFCEVKPNVLWRGSKPDKDGAAWLIEHGIRTIVNLEWAHDDLSTIRQVNITNASKYDVDYFRVRDWEPLPLFAPSVEDEHVVHFLAIASQQAKPVYVHCRSGENRTGVMVAAYRILIGDEKDIEMVIDEMKSYHGFWSSADARYIRRLSLQRDKILQKVKDTVSALERTARIVCESGKCDVVAERIR